MRRSLVGIVPDEILNGSEKHSSAALPRTFIAAHWETIQSDPRHDLAESLGIVSAAAFRQSLEDVHRGREVPIVPIQRTLLLEGWLRNLALGTAGQHCPYSKSRIYEFASFRSHGKYCGTTNFS
jgi:hypothetical protein